MNWQQTAETRIEEMVNEIKFYINEGVNKEKAVQIVKEQTTLNNKYWQMVLQQLD